jgi:hypothetical protein
MKPNQVRHVQTAGDLIHARSINTAGRIVPRCNARKSSRSCEDLIVTGRTARVTCQKCQVVS